MHTQQRLLEEERDDLRSEIAAMRKELTDANHRATAAVESAAALQVCARACLYMRFLCV